MLSAKRTRSALLWLAGCGKTMLARENFVGPHRWHNGKTPGRMLKKAVQRSVRRESLNVKGFGGREPGNPTFHVSRLTFHGSWERRENAAGGLFQHPVRAYPRWDYWPWHTVFAGFVRPCTQADRHTPHISSPRPWQWDLEPRRWPCS